MSGRFEALGLLLLPVVLAAVAGPPSLSGLRATEPTAPLLAVMGVLAWICVGWLLLVLAVTWFARTGRPAAVAVLHLLAPASVRWAARTVLGLAVGAASLTTAPVLAAPVVPPPIDLDWSPAVEPSASSPAPPAPTPTAATPTPPAPRDAVTRPVLARPSAVPAGSQVVVRAGDSLWAIAARGLGPSASAREIAAAWPQWWRANQQQIGSNPDLIHPGAVLLRPATRGES